MAAFDAETAGEAGKKSGVVRRRRRELPAEQRALEAIRDATDQLTRELLDAALGRGAFVELKPSERLKALQRALEYGLGRPGASAKGDSEAPDVPTGESLFG